MAVFFVLRFADDEQFFMNLVLDGDAGFAVHLWRWLALKHVGLAKTLFAYWLLTLF